MAVCRQMKCVDTGSTSVDRRLPDEDDETNQSLYQSPSSLLPSSTSDVDARTPEVTRASPAATHQNAAGDVTAERAVEDHLRDDDQHPTAATLNDDAVAEHSSPVWIPREPKSSDVKLTSSDVTDLTSHDVRDTPTKLKTDTSLPSDVEHGKYVSPLAERVATNKL